MPEVGEVVTYVDEHRREYKALITAVWPNEYGEGNMGLNLVIVSQDLSQTDDYGRQIIRPSSVAHKKVQQMPGRYWY